VSVAARSDATEILSNGSFPSLESSSAGHEQAGVTLNNGEKIIEFVAMPAANCPTTAKRPGAKPFPDFDAGFFGPVCARQFPAATRECVPAPARQFRLLIMQPSNPPAIRAGK